MSEGDIYYGYGALFIILFIFFIILLHYYFQPIQSKILHTRRESQLQFKKRKTKKVFERPRLSTIEEAEEDLYLKKNG
jgi:predicted Holliday junction resolvase-like endonuclease